MGPGATRGLETRYAQPTEGDGPPRHVSRGLVSLAFSGSSSATCQESRQTKGRRAPLPGLRGCGEQHTFTLITVRKERSAPGAGVSFRRHTKLAGKTGFSEAFTSLPLSTWCSPGVHRYGKRWLSRGGLFYTPILSQRSQVLPVREVRTRLEAALWWEHSPFFTGTTGEGGFWGPRHKGTL